MYKEMEKPTLPLDLFNSEDLAENKQKAGKKARID